MKNLQDKITAGFSNKMLFAYGDIENKIHINKYFYQNAT